LNFQVGDRAGVFGTPVDDALAAIDESFFIESDEYLADSAAQPLVQREALALPVARCAQAAMLVLDAMLVLAHPLPDTLDKALAAQRMPVGAFACDLTLDDGLRGDARVILARHPERWVAQHAMVADHDVFERRGDGMPEMQRAGHVRRRHAD